MNEFDLKALTWDENPQNVERAKVIAEKIRSAFPGLNKMTGFEYGCGTGLLSMNLQQHLKSITLADSSDGMLAIVKSKIEKNGFNNINYLKTDLLSDADVSEKFDIIFTSMTLHHVLDIDAMLVRLNAMLNDGGHLCIADLDTEDGSFHGEGFVGHLGFDREKLSQQLEKSGFANINTESCFEITKATATGEMRTYPVFLMMGGKV